MTGSNATQGTPTGTQAGGDAQSQATSHRTEGVVIATRELAAGTASRLPPDGMTGTRRRDGTPTGG